MKNISNKLKLACALLLSVPIACKAMEEKKNPNPIVYLFVTYEPDGTSDCLANGEALRSEFIDGINANIEQSTPNRTDSIIPPKPKFREFAIEDDYQSLSAQEQINLARALYNDILKYKRFEFTPVHIIVSNPYAYEVVALATQLFTDKAKSLEMNAQSNATRDISITELSEAFINQLSIGRTTRSHRKPKNRGTILQTTKWRTKKKRQARRSKLYTNAY